MFVRVTLLWLPPENFQPFLKTGIISDSDQSERIVFDSHILINTSVNLTKITLPPSCVPQDLFRLVLLLFLVPGDLRLSRLLQLLKGQYRCCIQDPTA
ncbi:unnamed protein product [Heterobilharzia americana]|nr:unnamed protein product [Heterobilharzia americana]